ncbi:protein APCDD1-like [Sitophilus oryzae]|uniref:Protein APCDD1-like n=1 Tax=Sitophilus oryzae TaxID=7048 RepID=A0A6J2XIW9_SITOR|nr:protein APCDD1-like [Sitophilus oryzae]
MKIFFGIFAVVLVIKLVASSSCKKISELAALEDGGTVVETTSKMLTGTWISEGCETRPGPEYVIRSYTFEENGNAFLVQHHYSDDSCSSPQLTVLSYGRLQLRDSFVQPQAASGTYKIQNISVIPQDTNAAKELDRTVSLECPGQYWKLWRKYEEHIVYDARYDEKKTFNLWMSTDNNNHHAANSRGGNVRFSDINCLGSLKWAFTELKLLKVQLRPLADQIKKYPRQVKMELLLGDIHTNYRLRQYHKPTSFQVPLIKQIKEPVTVFLNRHSYTVKDAHVIPQNLFTNPRTPPHLLEKPHLPPYIWGEWTSTRCESRPMGLYLTRTFSFYSEDQTWIGEHKFYSDPFCKIEKFTVTAAGRFMLGDQNKELKSATNIDFSIERASLMVIDEKMIYDMRLPGLCGLDEWEVNVPKELSTTGGCPQLGITLPSILHDILKIEMDYKGAILLFLGQVKTDIFNTASDGSLRPSAFQLPLMKCGEVPAYSQGLRDFLDDQFGSFNTGTNSNKISFIWMWCVVIALYEYFRD